MSMEREDAKEHSDNPFLDALIEYEDTDWVTKQITIPRSYELGKLRDIFAAGERIAAIQGSVGVGKTTLSDIFSTQNSDAFPGGIVRMYGYDIRRKGILCQDVLSDIAAKPVLLIIDELDALPSIGLSEIRSALKMYPLLDILVISQMPTQLKVPRKNIIPLGGLSEMETFDLLKRRLLLFYGNDAEQLLSSIVNDPYVLQSGKKSITELLEAAAKFFSRDFRLSGLYGPDGRPIDAGSQAYQQIVVDIGGVNEALISQLRNDPALMWSLPPRKFEELIAELLAKLGYKISLTAASKDGGFDMYAAKKDHLGQFLYLVECKRYTPPNKVGIELVRALHGTVQAQGATAGILVTSSYFTAGAKAFQKKTTYRIQLHDYLEIQQ